MNLIEKPKLWLLTPLLAAIFAGCAGGTLSRSVGRADNGMPQVHRSTIRAVSAVPEWLRAYSEQSSSVIAPGAARKGMYVSSFNGTEVEGFGNAGKGPLCTVDTGKDAYVNDIAVDPKGNLIVPLGGSKEIAVYRGPGMCGTEVGSFSDPYGQPSDAASLNATTGTIAVANIVGSGSSPGNIAICTLKAGCTKELTNPNIAGYGGGVAMAPNGDCWLTSDQVGSYYIYPPAMTYWKSCTGSGEAVTGYQNTAYGSISIDSHGDLVSLDLGGYYQDSQLWVYKGCNPNCTLVGGPFPLHAREVFGGLNQKSDEYGVTEYRGAFYPYSLTDIYRYSPTRVTYKYSFRNFLGAYEPEGFAFSPSSKR
ncbi:MAG TPA: hypothetical protein VGI19_02065 [Candidatus Cybelea sp.]|jgi:hypothetical protein